MNRFLKLTGLSLICLIMSLTSFSQMGAAQKIVLDIDTAVNLNVSVATLWDSIKDPATWAAFSNGYIKSIEASGDFQGLKRTLHFSDGRERTDVVKQYQPEYKFIVITITGVPASIKDNFFMFTATSEGKGLSKLNIAVRVEGDKKEKAALLNALKPEIQAYIMGLTEYFQKKD